MERLTKNLHPIYVLTEEMEKEYITDKMKKLTDKLGVYEDLEEQIGYPLEAAVRGFELLCKAFDFRERCENVWEYGCSPECTYFDLDEEMDYADFTKEEREDLLRALNWWINADKSE